MKQIDKSNLSSDEFAMYSQSKLKLEQSVSDMYELLRYPPFSFDKNGNSTDIYGEVLADINQTLLNIDEEDFITDRYVPLSDVKKKYASEILEAKRIKDGSPNLASAIKKWFDDNGIKMDESIAYNYGIG